MTLQFSPPDWLIKEYMNRSTPGEQANAGIQSALQTYATLDAQKQQKQHQLYDTYVKAFEAGGPDFAKDVASKMGLRNPPMLPGQTPIPGQTPVQPPVQDGPLAMGVQEGAIAPSPTHIIDHWNSQMAPTQASPTPTPTPTPPSPYQGPGVVPGFENPEALLNMGKYGSGRLAAGESLGKFRNAMEQNQPVTIDQYSALQSGDAEALAKAYPGGIPRGLAGSALAAQSRNVRVMTDPYGNPIRVPVSGGKATPVDIPKENLNPLQKKLNPNEYKAFQSEVNDFDKDKTVSDNRTMLNSMANVESMVKNYNPSLTGPIASRQARAIAGEVGVLTDSDVARQSLDPSLLGRLKKAVSVAVTGELPADQLNVLKESLASMKQNAQMRIYSVANERATRLSNNFGGKVTPDELLGSMNLPSFYPSAKTGGSSQGQAAPPTVTSKAQYDALPSGAEYLGPDGAPHRKK